MRTRALSAAVVLAALLVLGGCTTKVVTSDSVTPLNTATATGTGRTLAAPDMAEMTFGVSALEPEADVALEKVSAAAASITEAVKKAGVSADDIKTANVSVYPEYSGYDDGTPQISGYRASVQVRVKVRDLGTLGDVIAAASGAGANEIGGPSFMLDDDAGAQDEAITDAIADARRRAETMAKATGKSLGAIVSVAETGVSIPPIYHGVEARAAADGAGVPIEPGQLDVTANVTVVFELK